MHRTTKRHPILPPICVLLFAACFWPTGIDLTDTLSTTAGQVSFGSDTNQPNPSETAGPMGTTGTSGTTGTTTGATETAGHSGTEPQPTTGPSVTSSTGTTGETTEGVTTGLPGTTLIPDPECGNGVVEAGEACDDGNRVNGDGCTTDCIKDRLFVFVTSQGHLPNFGSAAAADVICTQTAKNGSAVPPASYVAWVSDDTSVLSRMSDNPNLPYQRPDGLILALNLLDLLDGDLAVPIDIDENGILQPTVLDGCNSPEDAVWTGTHASGMVTPTNCSDWTVLNQNVFGIAGIMHAKDSKWSNSCSPACDYELRFYCVEQP